MMDQRVVMPSAILWDMDGTLIDSEPYWLAAECQLADLHGIEWSVEDGLTLIGSSLEYTGRYLYERGITWEPDRITEWLVSSVEGRIRADGVPWQPGALELLSEFNRLGIPQALVTMSYRQLVQPVLDVSPQVFATVICGDEIERGKPDPLPYVRAAQLLGVDVRDCVAFEDSVPGVSSAYSSGALTIAIELNVAIEARPGLTIIHGLNQMTVQDVIGLLRDRV